MTETKNYTLTVAITLVIANMIGTGVFTSLGYQLEALPSAFPILVLWAVGGVLSFCGALCYAELVSIWPRSGRRGADRPTRGARSALPRPEARTRRGARCRSWPTGT